MKILKPIVLKGNPKYNEKWLQEEIAKNPSILGLGDIELRNKEKKQPSGGRLDLLFEDSDNGKRYECELQLGSVDESHIIRTIEYWDVERRRYPQFDHTAVLVAEDVEHRFLNIIHLFNGQIPLIVLKMTAVEVGDDISIIFTKVVDEVQLGLPDDDEASEPTDRAYWEKVSTHEMLGLVDGIFSVVHEIDPEAKLNYNKHYIGLFRNNAAANYCFFRPKKRYIYMLCKSIPDDDLVQEVESTGLVVDKRPRWNETRIRFSAAPTKPQAEALAKLIRFSMDAYGV